jgi:hypothetical protein
MSDPHDHHFFPGFYLSRWVGTDGKLIEFTRKHNKLVSKPVGPRATGFETDLYEFKDLPPEDRQVLEKVCFDYLDRTGSDALTIHHDGGSWTDELKAAWSRFVIGLYVRHPDAMPELRAAMKAVVRVVRARSQKTNEPEQFANLDSFLATPLVSETIHAALVIRAFDQKKLIEDINKMHWTVIDVSMKSDRFATSDRPVCLHKFSEPNGWLFMPISPTKLFIAANAPSFLEDYKNQGPTDIVRRVNNFIVCRARRFVWASNKNLELFIQSKMSTNMETSLLPGFAKYVLAANSIGSPRAD